MIEQQQRVFMVGLGNPGKKYAKTRHNLGFLVIDQLLSQLNWTLFDEKAFLSKGAKGMYNGKEIHLLLPQTYMNESGWAVRKYLDYYKLNTAQLLIVCDDVALPFGQLRMRRQGSAGGHNGLKSAIAHLGTEQFARLRMGVGERLEGQTLSDYVLTDFNTEEQASLDAYTKRGAEVLMQIVKLTL